MVEKEIKKTGGSHLAKKPAKARRGRLTGKQKVLVALAVVLALALVLVLAWKALFVRPEIGSNKDGKPGSSTQSEPIDYGEGSEPRKDGERKSEDYYTVLILGRDTGGGGNTDTMLLASYDVTNQKAAVMSIPRDTMVNVSWDVKKINSVYNVNGGGEKGIKAVYKEVSQLVGFEPDYQVVVEWEAVGKIVDAIGGVYFDVPYNMDYEDPYQDLKIHQAKGYRLLNGDDAMQVIRWRKNNSGSSVGDSGRMEIQQNFLKALLSQMLTIQNMGNLNEIVQVFKDCVETDLSFQNILWFGQKAVFGGLKTENVEFFTMPWKGVGAWSRTYHQNLSYVVPVADELLRIVNEKLSPFTEEFTMRDLDIMSVNAGGSLRSSTGYVEDQQATVAPVKPPKAESDPVDEPDQPAVPEEPDGGEDQPPAEGDGSTVDTPSQGGEDQPLPPGGGEAEPESPGIVEPEPAAPDEPTGPEVPQQPTEPQEPADESGFIIIEPPPAE